ncbi:SRPBCC family protein [Aeromicrobium sp.]|uniref:SRPBCC family protein n=1 Tax=Aeromicrobium sp. TaxID=1871063 RepID=UPI002FC5A382
MKSIELDLERVIQAPIDQVFARLVDVEGHNDWMPKKGTMLKHTKQTSPGQPQVGTTYIDETSKGPLPGEILELEAPHKIVHHWWEKSKSGKLKYEGWPSYTLEPAGDNSTLVRHHAKLTIYGMYVVMAPIFRRFAIKERTVTIDALKASFEKSGPSAAR